jgi:Glycosyltransferase family 87
VAGNVTAEKAGWRLSALRTGLPLVWLSALLLFGIVFVSSLKTRANKNDFAIYYLAARELRGGVNPYITDFAATARSNGLEIKDVRRSTEPPPFLLLFEPLTRFQPAIAFLIWQAINVFALALALILLLGPGSGVSGPTAWTLAAIAIAYPAVLSHFWYGQSKLPLLLILVVMARLMRRGFDAGAGLLLGFAGLVRIYPFAIAGYLVLERRWRALALMIVACVIGGLATLALAGPALCISFVHGLSYLTAETWSAKSGDNAPLAFAIRVLHETGLARGEIPGSIQQALFAAIDAVVLVLSTRATLLNPPDRGCDPRLFSLWVATAIVLPPVSWDYDMTLLILPFAAIAIAARRGEASRRTIAAAIASYLLICLWRFSGIGDAQNVSGLAANLLKESASLSLLAAYLAAYWFVVDGPGRVAISFYELPLAGWRRMIGVAQKPS